MVIEQFIQTGKQLEIPPLKIGAFYLVKEEENRVYLEQVEPIYATPKPKVIVYKDIVLDTEQFIAIKNRSKVKLTRNEWKFLEIMNKTPFKVVKYTTILGYIWGYSYDDTQLVRVLVSRLRHTLRPDMFETISGVGMRLITD